MGCQYGGLRDGRAWRCITRYRPLAFVPGEAFQFDWSTEGLVGGGIPYQVQVAPLKLRASPVFWLVAYPSQGSGSIFNRHGGSVLYRCQHSKVMKRDSG